MIDLCDRFGTLPFGSESGPDEMTHFSYVIGDYDERRRFQVSGKMARMKWESKGLACMHMICDGMEAYAPKIEPRVWNLHMGDDFKIVEAKDKPRHFFGFIVPFYPRLQDCAWLQGLRSVSRSSMVEVERIQHFTDICYYKTSETSRKHVVFKHRSLEGMRQTNWKEMHLWSSIPPHPHIAPFDRIVVETDEARIVGFTTDYIPGNNLWKRPPRMVKLIWLRQLTKVVDDLNLRFGVWHRDIHPRNILLDASKDLIKLIDFDVAVRYGEKDKIWWSNREDAPAGRADTVGVAFTLYELITRDYECRAWLDSDLSKIMEIGRWEVHRDVVLDCEVDCFQRELSTWLQETRDRRTIRHFGECPECVAPPRAPPEPGLFTRRGRRDEYAQDGDKWVYKGEMDYEQPNCYPQYDSDFRQMGIPVIDWARPSQGNLEKGTIYLASGKPLIGELPIIDDGCGNGEADGGALCVAPSPDGPTGEEGTQPDEARVKGESGVLVASGRLVYHRITGGLWDLLSFLWERLPSW